MIDFIKNLRRQEEGVEAVTWIILILVGIGLVALIWQFIVPQFSNAAEDIGNCIEGSTSSGIGDC